jgi:hypothetical protein
MGFMPRAASGRVDDPKVGWKGKGLWSDFGSYAGWHIEGGYGTLQAYSVMDSILESMLYLVTISTPMIYAPRPSVQNLYSDRETSL